VTENALRETERLLNGLLEQNSQFPLAYKLAAVVAYSKGMLDEAIRQLERYQELWPKELPVDQDAAHMLAEFQREVEVDNGLAAAHARPTSTEPLTIRPGMAVRTASFSGMVCCIVVDRSVSNGPRYLLGPAHVLGSVPGTRVFPVEVNVADVLAEVARSAPDVVSTIAVLTGDTKVDPATDALRFAGVSGAQLGQVVRKTGAKTRVTAGRVVNVNSSVRIGGRGISEFSGVVVVEGSNGAFSRPGDAGSPVVDEEDRLIGMVFAGAGRLSYVMPIERILKELDVDLVR
jgi:hypothetical protein